MPNNHTTHGGNSPAAFLHFFRQFGQILATCSATGSTMLLVMVLVAAGCSENSAARVSGEVTLDDQPLENGAISFVPADGKGPSSEGVIVGGRYTVEVTPGSKRVEIRGFKSLGKRPYDAADPNSPLVEIHEPIVPEKYNVASSLQMNIDGSQGDANFALSSR